MLLLHFSGRFLAERWCSLEEYIQRDLAARDRFWSRATQAQAQRMWDSLSEKYRVPVRLLAARAGVVFGSDGHDVSPVVTTVTPAACGPSTAITGESPSGISFPSSSS